jgi:hypothetical protein
MLNRNFWMQEDCITNSQFDEFVKSTGYITEAELFRYCSLLIDTVQRDQRIGIY